MAINDAAFTKQVKKPRRESSHPFAISADAYEHSPRRNEITNYRKLYLTLLRAKQGAVQAQYDLGLHYDAVGDAESAELWFKHIIDHGDKNDATAQFVLGVLCIGGKGVTKSEKKALAWFRKSAKQDHPAGLNALGVMYLQGKGIRKSLKEAFKYFEQSANKGYRTGQFSLGWAYINGRGVTKDPNIALEWFRKAAVQGYAGAQYRLGRMYQNGRRVRKTRL